MVRDMAPSLLEPDGCSPPLSPVLTSTAATPWVKQRLLTIIIMEIILFIWLLFPQRLRLLAYQGLQRVGEYWHGWTAGTAYVQKLPFGLYLKYNATPGCPPNELCALRIVKHHTTIPVPRGIDLVFKRGQGKSAEGDGLECDPFLLISELPGVPLSQCVDAISDGDYARIELQLIDVASQLRNIPKDVNPSAAICNTLGKACQEPRIRDFTPIGPFADEAAFSQEMRFPDEPSRRGHQIVFTHADLNPRNILVRQVKGGDGRKHWEVSGIIDWETAGWYPEYWDCTKSLYEGFRWPRRHNDMMRRVFAAFGDYTAEIDVERRSWEMGDGL